MIAQNDHKSDIQCLQKLEDKVSSDNSVVSNGSFQDQNHPIPEFPENNSTIQSPKNEFSKDLSLKENKIKDQDTETNLINRINSIPMVAEGVNLVKCFVEDDTKPYSKYIKYALNTAESAIHSATEMVGSRFPNQVNAADQFASKSLDYLEDQFPVIFHQSSSEVYETSCKAVSDIVATPAAAIDSTLIAVAASAEAMLDTILPPASDEEETNEEEITTLQQVGAEAQRRIAKAVRKQYEDISSVTKSGSVLNIREADAYLQKVSGDIASMNEHLTLLVCRTKKSLENLKGASFNTIKDTQTKLIQSLRFEMDNVSKYILDSSIKLPEPLRSQINPTVKFLDKSVMKIAQEIKREDQTTIQKSKNLIILATESIPYLDEACSYFTSFLAKKN